MNTGPTHGASASGKNSSSPLNPASDLAVIILAAGHGTRMKSALPKVLHPVAGLPMLGHVLGLATSLSPARLGVVIGDHAPQVGEAATSYVADAKVFVQAPPKGTGDAVTQAMSILDGFQGTVLVLYADTPLLHADTVRQLILKSNEGFAISVLGFHPENTDHAYGRLILDQDSNLNRIVEHRDATTEERNVNFCNSGVMAINSEFLKTALPQITNDNAKGEYYLTDLVELAIKAGQKCSAVAADEDQVMGVDSRRGLAIAEAIWQTRRRGLAMDEGATLLDPSTVYFSHDTQIGKDVTIGQHVVFSPGVRVADNVEVKAHSHLEGANLAAGASVGPYARLRPGATIGAGAKVGNFVEIKNAVLSRGAKVSHLTYIGDADLGEEVNIGAGTITCNYDGFKKHRTTIKNGAFIGSNSSLVAPVTIGEGAYVGSGSVITKDVAPDALSVARGRQVAIRDWAKKFRDKQK